MKLKKLLHIFITAAVVGSVSTATWADKLDDIQKAGVVRIEVFDSNPPFGFIDASSKKITGLDVDVANYIGQELGVKVELVATNPANRIPLLKSNKADLIAANFTITKDRAKEVGFSIPYFSTGQKFIARKGVLKVPEDVAKLKVGADKGTVMEVAMRNQYPNTTVVSFNDTPQAFAALRSKNVQAITQDDAKLIGLLAALPEKVREEYEVSPFSITHEYQGVGVPLGEDALVEKINAILQKMEDSGVALEIYNRWFGPDTKSSMPRGDFKIGAPYQYE